MTQTDLARQLGISPQQLQKYEKGTNRIAGSRLRTLASVIGVSLADLMNEDNLASAVAALPADVSELASRLARLLQETRAPVVSAFHKIADALEGAEKGLEQA